MNNECILLASAAWTTPRTDINNEISVNLRNPEHLTPANLSWGGVERNPDVFLRHFAAGVDKQLVLNPQPPTIQTLVRIKTTVPPWIIVYYAVPLLLFTASLLKRSYWTSHRGLTTCCHNVPCLLVLLLLLVLMMMMTMICFAIYSVSTHKNKANFFLAYSVIKPQLNALIFGSDLRHNNANLAWLCLRPHRRNAHTW